MILDEILRRKRLDLKRIMQTRPLPDVRAEARSSPPVRNFEEALRNLDEVGIIAEIKRASPSAGRLRENLNPAELAGQYVAGGARAISVLTDRPYFQGTDEDLRAARSAVELPVLRKDFIVEEYQLWETRTLVADCVLLIARVLEQNQLADYQAIAREELGLSALVEVHSEQEVERALDTGAPIIGINNRDLDTFQVDVETTERLRAMIPEGVLVVSESGIRDSEDIVRLKACGVHAALIGEDLVRADDPKRRIQELRGVYHDTARNPRSH